MRRVIARGLFLALLMSVAGPAASRAQIQVQASVGSPGSQVNLSLFYDDLSSDGEWFDDPSYGTCWTPYDMSADWRPYYNGHWEYTDYGWAWASDERWGWATYHYGRWLFDDSYGWIWVPGNEWAPAWVAWRYSDDWVGWAPLPPMARWDGSIGLTFSDANAIPSHDWCFVPQRNLLDVRVYLQVTTIARNVTLLERSRDATRYEVREGRPANLGIDVAQVERVIQRPVPRVKIVDAAAPASGRGQARDKSSVGYYRPKIDAAPPEQAAVPRPARDRSAISDATIQRQRDQQQRKLDNDLKTERARLAKEQQGELRPQAKGPGADEVRKRHAAEQQAFEAHAAQQRKVLDQRMQKKIVKPDKTKPADKPADKPAPDQGKDKGQSQDKGQGQDKEKDKGNGNGSGK
jgi:hypothetical protein